jgi:hypothetical protein
VVGRDVELVGTRGTWPEPHVPVEVSRWVGRLAVADAVGVHAADTSGAAHDHVADGAVLHEVGQFAEYGRPAAVEADRTDASGLSFGVDHAAPLLDGYGERFFDEDVFSGLECHDGLDGVPVVGCGNADRVDVFAGQQFAEIGVASDVPAEFLPHLRHRDSRAQIGWVYRGPVASKVRFVHIAECDDLGFGVGHKAFEQLGSPVADADKSHADLSACFDRLHMSSSLSSAVRLRLWCQPHTMVRRPPGVNPVSKEWEPSRREGVRA